MPAAVVLLGSLQLCGVALAQSSSGALPPGFSEDADQVCLSPSSCIPKNNVLQITALSPPAGPLDGETHVVIVGTGFRNFGSLMRCRFGNMEVNTRLYAEEGDYIDPFNHTMMLCRAPKSPTPLEQDVPVEVTLNGEDYSSSGRFFRYYRHPALSGVSPVRGAASKSQVVTLTRTTATESGAWLPVGDKTITRCKFKAQILPNGKRQVQFEQHVNATVADNTELQCATPIADFVAPVHVEVTLNGQQYSSGGPIFEYEDNWHSPAVSGMKPGGRHGVASARVGSVAFYFGGEDAAFDGPGSGYSSELWGLHLDAMHDFYPSERQRDLNWQKLSLSTGGTPPSPRSYATFSAHATTLVLFGGVSSPYGAMHNDTFEYSTSLNTWQQVAVSGGPVAPRSEHTAIICSLATGCQPPDGRPRLYVFGGWGMQPCAGSHQCLTHMDDLVALDLNSMSWQPIDVNGEQPKPPARKGHTATLVNGSTMVIFGGSAWVADEDADNSYGYTTQTVNDLWSIDLTGADGFTWHPVYAVGDRPGPREGHGAALVAGRYIVVFGGFHMEDMYKNETYVLDTHSHPMVWTRPTLTGDRPSSRMGMSVLGLIDDEVLTFGGMAISGWASDIHVLQLGIGNEGLYPDVTHAEHNPPPQPPPPP